MQIFAKYRHPVPDGFQSYSVHLVDNSCTCTEDETGVSTVLIWDGVLVSGDLPENVLSGLSSLIYTTIQNATTAGLLLN
jgi:hypothetical protein